MDVENFGEIIERLRDILSEGVRLPNEILRQSEILPSVDSGRRESDRSIHFTHGDRNGNLVEVYASTLKALAGRTISQSSRFQERCRTCINRNKDFDKRVESEHLKDLKCAINPSYAMSGAGECADFVEDTAPKIAPCPIEPAPDEQVCHLMSLLVAAIQAIPRVARVEVNCYRGVIGWEYRLQVRKIAGTSRQFFIGARSLTPSTFTAMVNCLTEQLWEGDRPSLSPFIAHPWNRVQASGDCPISISRAEGYLAPSCSARSFVYRKCPHIPVLITPCETIVNGAYEEITVPIEIIELRLDGRSSGFCAKKIAGDGWSMIGPAFLVGGDR
jgi:hypothetical protein